MPPKEAILKITNSAAVLASAAITASPQCARVASSVVAGSRDWDDFAQTAQRGYTSIEVEHLGQLLPPLAVGAIFQRAL
jgi:hypothetical protein